MSVDNNNDNNPISIKSLITRLHEKFIISWKSVEMSSEALSKLVDTELIALSKSLKRKVQYNKRNIADMFC